jgi:4'-phosphopantetheinyl transferase
MGTEVHVWRIPLSATYHELSHLEQCLSPDEMTRAGQFFFARDRNRFVAARGSLRRILALYIDRQPHDVRFSYDTHGKPALAALEQGAGIEFNLSHSGDLALVAVALGFSVGVDIEQVRPELATAETAAHAFSVNEQIALAAIRQHRRTAAFFKCWTSKEAYIKGLGDGLGIPLAEFDVCVRPDMPVNLLRPYHGAANRGLWSLHDLNPGPGYAAALAAACGPGRIIVREWHHATAIRGEVAKTVAREATGGVGIA